MPERDPGGERVRRTFRLSGGTGGRARDEVREELEHHLELCTQELMNQGWSAVDARAEARRRFGGVEFTTEYCARETARVYADGRRTMWLDDLTQDLKYATRTLFRTPTYTLVVVLTLAAGIAANTTIFSLMNPYLFRPLPFPAADELVQLGGYNPLDGWDGGRFSAPEIADPDVRVRGQTPAAPAREHPDPADLPLAVGVVDESIQPHRCPDHGVEREPEARDELRVPDLEIVGVVAGREHRR